MKEITRVITAQITIIEHMPDDDANAIIKANEVAKANVANDLKKIYKADDVKVDIQDFVLDK